MKIGMKSLLFVALSTCAVSANAWTPEFYAGSNYGTYQLTQSEPALDANFTVLAVDAVAGIRVLPYVTFEARLGAGLNRDRETPSDLGILVEVETKYYGSLYFRPELRNEKASLYGLLGYTTMELDGAPQSANSETTQDGMSWGLGMGFVMHERVDLRIEWKRLLHADAIGVRGASVGFTYSF